MQCALPRVLLLGSGLLALATVVSCGGHHARDGAKVDARATCATCHMGEFEIAAPLHQAVSPIQPTPTTCELCHSTKHWRPAGLHAEEAFPVTIDPHLGVDCDQCHNVKLEPGYTAGNADCLRCHLRPDMDPIHDAEPDYAWDGQDRDFCRTCHPDGVTAGHPESAFPIEGGPHGGVDCQECHDQDIAPGYSSGPGGNVNCIGCHKHDNQAEMDQKHNDVNGYQWDASDPDFCADAGCHPDGRKHDD